MTIYPLEITLIVERNPSPVHYQNYRTRENVVQRENVVHRENVVQHRRTEYETYNTEKIIYKQGISILNNKFNRYCQKRY